VQFWIWTRNYLYGRLSPIDEILHYYFGHVEKIRSVCSKSNDLFYCLICVCSGAALFGMKIYKECARKENDDTYLLWAEELEKLAVEILDKFYQANPQRCTKAIIRQIPAYGNVTWLELAIAAKAKQFIAQKAVQDVLNNIWFGHIGQDVAIWKVVMSTVMIWCSGFLTYEEELVEAKDQGLFFDVKFSTISIQISNLFRLGCN